MRPLSIQKFMEIGETEKDLVIITHKNGEFHCEHRGPVTEISLQKGKIWQLSWSDSCGDPVVEIHKKTSGFGKIKMKEMMDYSDNQYEHTVIIREKEKRLKPTDIIKKGYYAYHVTCGKVDDFLGMLGDLAGYKDKLCQELVDDGWDFVCSFKKYKKGDKTKSKIWPKSPPKKVEAPKGKRYKLTLPCFACELMGKKCWPCLPFVLEEGCSVAKKVGL